jgi:hypothetical protein
MLLNIYAEGHNTTVVMLFVVKTNIIYAERCIFYHYAECSYVECRYTESRGVKEKLVTVDLHLKV